MALSGVPALNSYDLIHKVGEGSYGKVLLVRKHDDGQLYALKSIDKRRMLRQSSAKNFDHVVRESQVLQTIDFPFIMRMYAAFQDEDRFYFLCEFLKGGDLYKVVSTRGKLPLPWTKLYAAEIGLALDHLHSFAYVYRDLKLENVLVSDAGHCKLADFGLAKKHDGGRGTMAGTVVTMAPEMLRGAEYDAAVDWWSLGVVFCEMLFGGSPIPAIGRGSTIRHSSGSAPPLGLEGLLELFRRERHLDSVPDDVDSHARQAIFGLLSVNVAQRVRSLDMFKKLALYDDFGWNEVLELRRPGPLADADVELLEQQEGPHGDGFGSIAGGSVAVINDSSKPERAIEERHEMLRSSERKFSSFMSAAMANVIKSSTGGSNGHVDVSSTAICEAASRGDITQLRKIASGGGNISLADYDYRTGLHVACAEGQFATVKVLIEELGATVNAEDRFGGTPFDDADRNDFREICSYLKQCGAKKKRRNSNLVTSERVTATHLCEAASRGDSNALRRFAAAFVDVDEGNFDSRTAMHVAAAEGHLETIVVLVEELSANHSPMDRWGQTPLDEAERFNRSRVAKYLRLKGAEQRQAMLSKAVAGGSGDGLVDRVCAAAARGDLDAVKTMAVAGANLEAKNFDRRTPLHVAAAENHIRMVKYLVESGVNLNPKDRWKGTPLDDAKRHTNRAVINYLSKQGALSGADVKQPRLSSLLSRLRARASSTTSQGSMSKTYADFKALFAKRRGSGRGSGVHSQSHGSIKSTSQAENTPSASFVTSSSLSLDESLKQQSSPPSRSTSPLRQRAPSQQELEMMEAMPDDAPPSVLAMAGVQQQGLLAPLRRERAPSCHMSLEQAHDLMHAPRQPSRQRQPSRSGAMRVQAV